MVYFYAFRLTRVKGPKTCFVVPQERHGKIGDKIFILRSPLATPNRRLLDKKILWDWVPPYEKVLEYKALSNKRGPALAGRSGQVSALQIYENLEWSSLLNEARTFFERNLTP